MSELANRYLSVNRVRRSLSSQVLTLAPVITATSFGEQPLPNDAELQCGGVQAVLERRHIGVPMICHSMPNGMSTIGSFTWCLFDVQQQSAEFPQRWERAWRIYR
jgi:hypothetical protein